MRKGDVWADDFCGLGGRRCVLSIRIIPRCAFLDKGELLGKWCGYGEVGIGVWAMGGGVEIGSGDSMEWVLFDWSRCFEIPDGWGARNRAILIRTGGGY